MVSICLCTIDRYDLTVQCVGQALSTAGYAYELLVTDNGSTDERVNEYIQTLKPSYHCVNKTNEGYARMMNQMLLRAEGEYLCVLDNDLLLPRDWLATLVECNRAILNSGISAVHVYQEIPPAQVIEGHLVYPTLHPLGIKFFNRAVLEKLGYFDEEFHPYGHEDIALHVRSQCAGLFNYYAMLGGQHLGFPNPGSEYDEMKRIAIARGADILQMRVKKAYGGDYYTPAPPFN